MDSKFTMKSIDELLSKRNLAEKQNTQQFIDSEVIRLSNPYVPFDTGTLARSGVVSTNIGSGVVKWNTPYARRQYYTHSSTNGRGRLWFERMKAQHKQSILIGASKISGGKVVK